MYSLVKIFKALSDRSRLRVVSVLLRLKELCACQLVELLQVKGATVSRHMGVLIASGLVQSRKDGRWVYYRINKKKLQNDVLLDWIEICLKDNPDAIEDEVRLASIMACEPEELCRKQRGAKG